MSPKHFLSSRNPSYNLYLFDFDVFASQNGVRAHQRWWFSPNRAKTALKFPPPSHLRRNSLKAVGRPGSEIMHEKGFGEQLHSLEISKPLFMKTTCRHFSLHAQKPCKTINNCCHGCHWSSRFGILKIGCVDPEKNTQSCMSLPKPQKYSFIERDGFSLKITAFLRKCACGLEAKLHILGRRTHTRIHKNPDISASRPARKAFFFLKQGSISRATFSNSFQEN